ncbi:MAG: serine/threonine protein kinase [Deltaproteobacteria bacterium]|nr:serine/threonine protein kinase [Deltaproteobacteria bacterium]
MGTTIAGRYRVLSRIAAGGMGVVYRAEQVFLKHEVVIKRLNPELTGHGTAVERFTREAQAAVRIDHPNVCRVLDCGTSEDGSVYIAMELLKGQLLTERIAELEILPLDEIIDIGGQICDALERAHTLGIVHRDLKPDNVMLVARPDGKGDQAKIMDFGVAKLQHAGDGKALTQAGMVFGTPKYMAAEQAAGEPLDARADLYSLGVMLFEMATGRVPFEAPTVSGLLTKHLTEPAPMLEDAAPHLAYPLQFRELVARCLVKDPVHRIQTATEVGAALRACTGLRPSLIGPPAPRRPRASPAAATVPAATGPGTPPRTDELLTTGFEPLKPADLTRPVPARRPFPVVALAVAGGLLAAVVVAVLLWTGGEDAPRDSATVAAAPTGDAQPSTEREAGADAPLEPEAAETATPPTPDVAAAPDAPAADAPDDAIEAATTPEAAAAAREAAAREAAADRRVWEAGQPLVLEARELEAQGNPGGAVTLLLPLEEHLEQDPHYHFELARLFGILDRPMDAVPHALRASALDARYAGAPELLDVALRGLLRPATVDAALLFLDRSLEPGLAERLAVFVLEKVRAVASAQRVRELLDRRALLDGLPDHLRLPLLVIVTEDCAARRALLDRIAAAPDGRMAPYLERFQSETGCGPRRRRDCWPCERPSLRAAMAAVREAARLAPFIDAGAAP